MKKRSSGRGGNSYLRLKAEEQLRLRSPEKNETASKADLLKLIHELEVHQIELELQSEELILANSQARAASEKYEELYDFAPSGYFTLSRQGTILEMNLCAAKMLGKARSLLINSRFDSHLEVDSRFVFKKFLEEVFQSKSNIICDVILSNSGDNTMHLHLTGIISETHEQCHVTATDITELKLVGSALSQNEERLRLALKATNDVVWDWDILNDTQRWNEAGTKVFGWTEIVKNTVSAAWWIERVHPDDRQRVEKGFYAVVKNNTVEKWQDEYRFRKADGSYAEVLDRGYILRNDQGSAIRMIGAMLDITEQKNTGKELRESEARFRNLMEGIDSIAVQGYSPDGITRFWNKASEKLYGYTQQEAIGRNLLDLIIPDEMKNEVSRAINNMAETGEPVPSGELELKHKDGSPIPVLSSHTIVKVPGHSQELFCLDIDIAWRRKAEEALRLNKDLLNASQSLSKTGGWEWNAETQAMYWTEETYRIHDLSPFEIEPGSKEHIRLSSQCYRKDDRPVVLAAFQRCLKKGIPYDLELPFTTIKGRRLWIRTSAQPVIEGGKTVRVIGNIIDITERKLAEIEIKRSKELLRNLNKRLNEIREEERTLLSRELHDQFGQALTALKIDLNDLQYQIRTSPDASAKLSDMIGMVSNIIRDVQRISSDLRPEILYDLGLVPAIEWVTGSFEKRTGVKCTLETDDHNYSDPTINLALFRILQESLTNVIRHAKASSVFVSLQHKKDGTIMTISDDGTGIAEKCIESSKSLGIIGMQERARQIGGSLEITSGKKAGTTLTIRIP
jgi:PAS domain S-box-containing protein